MLRTLNSVRLDAVGMCKARTVRTRLMMNKLEQGKTEGGRLFRKPITVVLAWTREC